MTIVNKLRNISLSRKSFLICFLVLAGVGSLWRLSLLDMALFLENNLEKELAWTIMILYLKGLAIVFNSALVLAFALRCRNIGVNMLYGFVIPCFAMYITIHFKDITPLYVLVLFTVYLTFRSGPSDVKLSEYIFEDK